jgi:hypothetical protein
LLTKVSISVNNLKIAVTQDNHIEIATNGVWKGKTEDFIDALEELLRDLNGED